MSGRQGIKLILPELAPSGQREMPTFLEMVFLTFRLIFV